MNKMLRNVFGHKRQAVIEEGRRLHNKNFIIFLSLYPVSLG
jgi:hypothetical protein